MPQPGTTLLRPSWPNYCRDTGLLAQKLAWIHHPGMHPGHLGCVSSGALLLPQASQVTPASLRQPQSRPWHKRCSPFLQGLPYDLPCPLPREGAPKPQDSLGDDSGSLLTEFCLPCALRADFTLPQSLSVGSHNSDFSFLGPFLFGPIRLLLQKCPPSSSRCSHLACVCMISLITSLKQPGRLVSSQQAWGLCLRVRWGSLLETALPSRTVSAFCSLHLEPIAY